MMSQLKYRKIWIVIGIIEIILTYIICLVPMKAGQPGIPHLDKIVHTGIYTVLTLWFLLSFEHNYLKTIILGFILMGVSIELLQDLTPSRSFDYFDILANVTGCFFGLILSKNLLQNLFLRFESLLSRKL